MRVLGLIARIISKNKSSDFASDLSSFNAEYKRFARKVQSLQKIALPPLME
jgi:hypothetical protein